MFIIGAVALLALLAATAIALRTGDKLSAAVALVLAAGWPFVNARWEGPVLWVPVRGHGLTVSDLLTPLVFSLVVIRHLAGRRTDARDAA